MRIDVLRPKTLRRKPAFLMEAVTRAARLRGHEVQIRERYGQSDSFLIMYGWGGTEQQRAVELHRGHYCCFDLGYWDRDGFDTRQWRIAFDGFHSPRLVMKGETPPVHRLGNLRLRVSKKNRDSKGPILIVGSGPKSQKVGAKDWAARAANRARKAFPGRPVWYKPKPGRPIEKNVRYDRLVEGPIGPILERVGLVYARHSNVAVDACFLGVPVVCEDGAAAAIYPATLEQYEAQPSYITRLEFLTRLAWWQYSINDIRQGRFVPWLEERVAELVP